MTVSACAIWPTTDATQTMFDGSDEALVGQTKAGEVEAFSELVRRHQTAVYNLCFRFMRDPALAEDMAQEAFIKAFRLLRGFRGDSSFSTWLYRVACSVCLTELGRRKKRFGIALPLSGAAVEAATPPVSVSDMPEAIRRCVTKLPARYAQAVTLYYLQELSYEEVAAVMQVSLGTLKTWLHRARHQLREIVEKELPSDEFPVS